MEKKKDNSRDFSSRQRSGYKRLSRFERESSPEMAELGSTYLKLFKKPVY